MPGRLPANIKVAPNSPIERAQVIIMPDIIWRIVRGRIIVKKSLRFDPVRILALFIRSGLMFSNAIFADLSINGEATNICANTTAIILPGKVRPKLLSKGPKRPLGAKAKSRATPATAGGKTIGISNIVSIIERPENLRVASKYAVGTAKQNDPTVAIKEASNPKEIAFRI
jgi:hypothetical protein